MIDNFIGHLEEHDYRSRQGAGAIGGSGLARIDSHSIAHWRADVERMKTSTPGAFGTLVHCLLLEPTAFASRYFVRPDALQRLDMVEPRKVDADAAAAPHKVAAPELHKRDALEVVLLEGFEVYKCGMGGWSFDESAQLDDSGSDAAVAYDTKRAALEAASTLDPYAFSDYAGKTMRFASKEDAEFVTRAIDGGRWIIRELAEDGEAYALAPHMCEACAGAGATMAEDPAVITIECWRCYGAGLANGFATQAEAKAHAATVSGWTLDGVTFYKHKKDVPAVASDKPSGWTVNDVDFYATKKELLETDAGKPWRLSDSVDGPFFRTRDDANAHAAERAGARIPITLADLERASDCVRAVESHEVAGPLLAAMGERELSVLWHDTDNDADCSGQLDAYGENEAGVELEGLFVEAGKRIGLDVKTTGKLVAPGDESKTILNGGHHIQGAHYMAGCAANSKPVDTWIMLYIETAAPHGVRVVQLGETFLALGRYKRELALDKVKAWRAMGAEALPPSYPSRCVTVDPPEWAVPAAVGDAEWADWLEAGKVDKKAEALQLARDAHSLAEDVVERIERELDAVLDGRSKLAAEAVAAARDGEYGTACTLTDGFAATDAKIDHLRGEHVAAERTLREAYAALQGARNA